MKKMMVVMVLILAMVCVVPAMSMAAAWKTCNVISAGAGGGKTMIELTDTAATPAFANRWFTASTTDANQQLATALTAISLGKTVLVNLAAFSANATINTLYVNQ